MISFGQVPIVGSGSIKHFEKFPSKFVLPRNVDVWLPDGYSSKSKYAVLYIHDGQDMFDSIVSEDHVEWKIDETLTRLQKEGKIRKTIVVAISNTGKFRHSDYFPQKPFQSFSKQKQDSLYKVKWGKNLMIHKEIESNSYLKFIVQELKPFIDSSFSTVKNRQNTFTMGSSMGGLISMYAVCEYPTVFGGAACLSTHWNGLLPEKNNAIPNAFLEYLTNNTPDPKIHLFYFDYGTIMPDFFYKPLQAKVDSLFQLKGYTQVNYLSKEFVGADHSPKSWSARVDVPLYFLLKK
jgi:enterochelin esterase-like enzyme